MLGHPDPRLGAVMIQGMVEAASKRISVGADPVEVTETAVAMVLFGGLGSARRASQARQQGIGPGRRG